MKMPVFPPQWQNVFAPEVFSVEMLKKLSDPSVLEFVRRANHDYLHWDKIRRLPRPDAALTKDEIWAAIQMSRMAHFQDVPLSFTEIGQPLRFWIPPRHSEWLHIIDQDAGGLIGSRSKHSVHDDDDRYLFNSLMEEAIASSQLEGASTTRVAAKKMLRDNRRPRNHDEQMILNNYRAILEIRDLRRERLTPEMLCHIQSVMTEKTLRNPDEAGRFRAADDGQVFVANRFTNEVIHTAPDVSTLDRRIKEVCDFANHDTKNFIHPVIKAIALHFAIGYIHPFTDGNGRTARAIFYWYMLKKGYWIFEYLPISRIFLSAPIKYVRAYCYTETDSGDLTYFVHFHLRAIARAISALHEYVLEQSHKLKDAAEYLKNYPELNHRQIGLVYEALKNLAMSMSIRQYAGTHNVTSATARADLFELTKEKFLQKRQEGKRWVFTPALHLSKKIRKFTQPPESKG